MTVGIVGLGLISGSMAKAYSEARHKVLAHNRTCTCQSAEACLVCQLREVVFFTQVTEIQMLRSAFYKLHRSFCASLVAKMPHIRKDTSFQIIGVSTVVEHTYIVVGFKHNKVAARQIFSYGVGHMSDIRCYGNSLTVSGFYYISAAFQTVVRSGEGADGQTADTHTLITDFICGIFTVDYITHSHKRTLCCIDGDVML